MGIWAKWKSTLVWILFLLVVYIGFGALLFPWWWRQFFFGGGILSVDCWRDGLQAVAYHITDRSLLIILLLIVIYILLDKRLPTSVMSGLDVLKGWRLIITLVLGVLISLGLCFVPESSMNLPIQNPSSMVSNKATTKRYQMPIDFYYLDQIRVANLYDQISPELILDEKSVEKSQESKKRIEGGAKDIIKGEQSKSSGEKDSIKFKAKQPTPPVMVLEILNFLSEKGLLREFETLELSTNELRSLDDFKAISQSYGIGYDTKRYATVYNEVIKKTVTEQQDELKDLNSQVLVKGKFSVECSNNRITLSHEYFRQGPVKIVFSIEPIPGDSPFIVSATLKNRDSLKKTISLNAFSKSIRAVTKGTEQILYCEAYAIW